MSGSGTPAHSSSAQQAVRRAAWRLQEAGVSTEALAEFIPAKRVFGLRRKPRFAPLGEVWRVGRFLITNRGELLRHGHTTRAEKRERLGVTAEAQEARRDIAGYAYASGYAAGIEVNYDAAPITLTEHGVTAARQNDPSFPLAWVEGTLRVLWRHGVPPKTAPDFESYLDERVEMMIHPPGQDSGW